MTRKKSLEQEREPPVSSEKNFIINGYPVERYLASDISEELLERLAKELSPLTCEGFMRDCVTPELVADVTAHLKVADRILIVRNDAGEPVAFMTTSMHQFKTDSGDDLMYHLEGIIVKPEHQGTGLSKLLIARDVKDSGATYLGFHTQNARMKALGGKIAYLNDTDAYRYGWVIDSRQQKGVVDVNRYGGSSLYGNRDRFSTTAINEIDWQKGDAAVCIGPIREEILR